MNILALGDSFTYGDELTDRSSAWPAVLGRRLRATVDNQGICGGGSRQIVAKAITGILTTSLDLLVIGWPVPGRTEFADEDGVFDLKLGDTYDIMPEQPWRQTLIRYYNDHHNDDYMYQQYLLDILHVQSFIQQYQVKCVMMSTRNTNYYSQSASIENSQLLGHIDKTMFIDGGMNIWTATTKHGPRMHFLEDGHQLIADKVYEHIRN